MHLAIQQIKVFVNEFIKYIIKSRFSTRQSSRLHMQDGHYPCSFHPPNQLPCPAKRKCLSYKYINTCAHVSACLCLLLASYVVCGLLDKQYWKSWGFANQPEQLGQYNDTATGWMTNDHTRTTDCSLLQNIPYWPLLQTSLFNRYWRLWPWSLPFMPCSETTLLDFYYVYLPRILLFLICCQFSLFSISSSKWLRCRLLFWLIPHVPFLNGYCCQWFHTRHYLHTTLLSFYRSHPVVWQYQYFIYSQLTQQFILK